MKRARVSDSTAPGAHTVRAATAVAAFAARGPATSGAGPKRLVAPGPPSRGAPPPPPPPPTAAAAAAAAALGADLDALFAGIGAKKAAAAAEAGAAAAAREAAAAKAAAERARAAARVAALEAAGRAANLRGDESPPALRFDAALGMRVFSAAGLRIGEGKGDTPDCPVDCHCCF
jgi:hypothetical protein